MPIAKTKCKCKEPVYSWESTESMGGRPEGPGQVDVEVRCLRCGGVRIVHANDWADRMFALMMHGFAAQKSD